MVDSLSKRSTLLSTMIVEVIGLEEMMKLYEEDSNFDKAWKDPWMCDINPNLDYFTQYFFLNHQLC